MSFRSALITLTKTYLPLLTGRLPRYKHLLTRSEGHTNSTYKPFLMHVRSALTTSERRQQRHAYPPTKAYLSHAYLAYKLSLMPVRSALTRLQRLAYRTLTRLKGHADSTYEPLLMSVRSALTRLQTLSYRPLTRLEGHACRA